MTSITGIATSFINFSRASNATVTDSNGVIKWAPHNLLLASEQFDNSNWARDNSTAVNPVVTANAGVAPNGQTTAERIVFDRTGGTFSRIQQLVSVPVGVIHTFSVWMKTYSGGTANVGLRLDATGINCVVTGSWTRFEVSAVGPAGGVLGCQIMLFSSIVGNDVTADVLVWGAHLYRSDLGGMQPNTSAYPMYNPTTPKNLLGSTEDFSAAAWNKSDVSLGNGFERISNGTFTTNMAGWTITAGTTATSSGGAAVITVTGDYQGIRQNVSNLIVGRRYQLSADLISMTGGGTTYIAINGMPSLGRAIPGKFLGYYTATATTHEIVASSFSGTTGFSIDNISFQEVQEYTAPNGLQTADKIVESTANGLHTIDQYYTTTASPYTFSIYLKRAERSFVLVYHGQSNTGIVVNLDTGAITLSAGISAPVASSATSVGDGWYRCSITVNATAASNFFRLYTMPSATVISYTGDGTSGVYLWGAQLSDSASLDTYSPVYGAAVTSAAYYGPRRDYDPVTLAAKGLLVEEQRTNLLLQSAEFDNASWVKSRATVTANATTSPSGGVNACKLIEDTATGTHRIYQAAAKSAVSLTRTFSVYLKAAERTLVSIRVTDNNETVVAAASVDLSVGTVAAPTISGGSSISTATSSITFVGNGWYRCVITATFDATILNPAAFVSLRDGAGLTSYTGDGTSGIFVFGAQWEDGSFATSYIPVGATTAGATRNADVASVSTQAFPYSATEGTLVAQVDMFSSGTVFSGFVTLADSLSPSTSWVSLHGRASSLESARRANSVSATNLTITTTTAINTPVKTGVAFSVGGTDAFSNGASITTQSGVAANYANTLLRIGSFSSGGNPADLNGHIRQITYLPRRISSSELQTRTQ